MFNKRESREAETSNHAGTDRPAQGTQQTPAPARSSGSAGAATIGPSISIDGQLKGEEDLVVEGRIKGTVELKNNTLTVGTQGTLDAEVFAHTIFVEGTVTGDLYASERISIRKSAQIKGNILAPRISLEDGAKFRGSIDMDADSEAFRKAFGGKSSATASKPATAPGPSDNDKIKPKPDSSPDAGSSKSGQTTPQPGKTGTSAA
mgnify:CR=1 FL=1